MPAEHPHAAGCGHGADQPIPHSPGHHRVTTAGPKLPQSQPKVPQNVEFCCYFPLAGRPGPLLSPNPALRRRLPRSVRTPAPVREEPGTGEAPVGAHHSRELGLSRCLSLCQIPARRQAPRASPRQRRRRTRRRRKATAHPQWRNRTQRSCAGAGYRNWQRLPTDTAGIPGAPSSSHATGWENRSGLAAFHPFFHPNPCPEAKPNPGCTQKPNLAPSTVAELPFQAHFSLFFPSFSP